MRSFKGSWAAKPRTAVSTAEVVTRPTISMLDCLCRVRPINSPLLIMKSRSRSIFGLYGKSRTLGSSSRISHIRERLMAMAVSIPATMLRSIAAICGIGKALSDCSVMLARWLEHQPRELLHLKRCFLQQWAPAFSIAICRLPSSTCTSPSIMNTMLSEGFPFFIKMLFSGTSSIDMYSARLAISSALKECFRLPSCCRASIRALRSMSDAELIGPKEPFCYLAVSWL